MEEEKIEITEVEEVEQNQLGLSVNLTQQQRDWLYKQHNFGLPIYAAMGINDKVLLTQDFYKKSFSVQEFEEKAVHVKEFVNIISNICLNKGT